MSATRRAPAPARRTAPGRRTVRGAAPGGPPADVLALFGTLLAATAAILLHAPALRVAGGLLLPVPVQGAALALAALPAPARRGLLATAGALGVVATILEVVAVDRLGIGVTRGSVTAACVAVTLGALAVAARRGDRPHLRVPLPRSGPARAVAVGLGAATVLAAAVGTRIPMVADEPYSAVAFAGPLSRVDGVLTVPVGARTPVSVTVTNAERAGTRYAVSVRRDGGPAVGRGAVTVGAGDARDVAVGDASAGDGCLHRFAVEVRSPTQAYLLTLYLRGAGAPCPRR